ncbi:MAG: glycoside hydrolase family 95 protein [Akkermansiaceae bacterium]|nr:glycoside hydrolase family 95 protein [Akkermansiaceae bacterium]
MKHLVILALCIAPAASGLALADDQNPMRLWYSQPAGRWEEALPVGNGRLGAMVFGSPENERIQLNEDTVWAGGPYNPVNPRAKDALPEVRKLIDAGKYKEAENLIDERILAQPRGQMPYQTVGDLRLRFPEGKVTGYRRELDLETAITSVSYTLDGVVHTREVFSSIPDNVIVVRLTAGAPGSISFAAGMESPMESSVNVENETLIMRGKGADWSGVKGAIQYEARVRFIAEGGRISATNNEVSVEKADSVTLLISAATNFVNFEDISGDPTARSAKALAAADENTYSELRAAHLGVYQPLFRRVRIDLGRPDAMKLPTNERIERFADGDDPQLAALYYQFGRYLLISSSLPGSQPANLQGIWNASTNPPWQSKYTLNINAEMNYWAAESGNLAECVEPLIKMVEDLTVTGGRTAKEMYGTRGWVVHHNTDIWRASAPIDGANWGMWPTGGAWLCLHLWDRFLFSGDPAVLRRIYPIMKGSSEFFLDTLQEDPDGKWLVTNPSTSPELVHPKGSAVCAGPAMDMQILRDLFSHTIKAAEMMNVDPEFRKELATTRARLLPNQVGGAGQLQEWMDDWDMRNGDKHHRHVSHLYGLFPGRDISLRDTPQLADAASKSLDMRGDKATGWATAWRLCLWTHLGDGDRAWSILKHLITPELTYPNMFDSHPPFQIDGNFGGAAGIAEMILQSRLGEIDLLPALPKDLPDGRIAGLRTRGGLEVDVAWKQHELETVTLRFVRNGPRKVMLRHGDRSVELALRPGDVVSLNGKLQRNSDSH